MKKNRKPADRTSAELHGNNLRFHSEAMHFNLRYRCSDCLFSHPEGGECTLDYPEEDLRGEEHKAWSADGELVFCKDFELHDEPLPEAG